MNKIEILEIIDQQLKDLEEVKQEMINMYDTFKRIKDDRGIKQKYESSNLFKDCVFWTDEDSKKYYPVEYKAKLERQERMKSNSFIIKTCKIC